MPKKKKMKKQQTKSNKRGSKKGISRGAALAPVQIQQLRLFVKKHTLLKAAEILNTTTTILSRALAGSPLYKPSREKLIVSKVRESARRAKAKVIGKGKIRPIRKESFDVFKVVENK